MDIRANVLMRTRLKAQGLWLQELSLRPFRSLLGKGFVQRKGGLFWAARLRNKLPATDSQTPDMTGNEALINKTHIDDYVPSSHDKGLSRQLAHALLLANAVVVALEASAMKPGKLRQIIGLDVTAKTCTHRFHILREGEIYLLEDLESYQEPLLVMDSGAQREQGSLK